MATYDSVEMISDTEADAAMKVAVALDQLVMEWLERHHPELLE